MARRDRGPVGRAGQDIPGHCLLIPGLGVGAGPGGLVRGWLGPGVSALDPEGFSHLVPQDFLNMVSHERPGPRYSLKKWGHWFRCQVRAAVTWLGTLVTGVAVERAGSRRGSFSLWGGTDTDFVVVGKCMPVPTADAVV